MIKLYFFSFMRYLSEHKKLQAILIMLGGALVVVFVPYWIGLIIQTLLGVVCSPCWIVGALVTLAICFLARVVYAIYGCVLDKL